MIIFTHYPENPDEDDISKYELFKKEIKQELDKIFQVPAELKLPDIPIYFMNTKIFKKDGIKFFDKNSELAANDFIEELKLRISSTTYSIIDTTDLDCDKESIVQKIEKEKREKLNRDLEIEEQRYRELMSRRQSNNRDSLTGFGIFGAGAILLGLAGGCNIF